MLCFGACAGKARLSFLEVHGYFLTTMERPGEFVIGVKNVVVSSYAAKVLSIPLLLIELGYLRRRGQFYLKVVTLLIPG